MKRVQIARNLAVKSSLLYFSFFFSDNEGKNLKHLSATEGMTYMNIGNAITEIRKTQGLTQEEFGALFHVTRQTVSNWENEKNYPDLQILVNISDQFNVSLDQLLKSDQQMILQIDKERSLGKLRREKKIIDFLNGAGTGLILGCVGRVIRADHFDIPFFQSFDQSLYIFPGTQRRVHFVIRIIPGDII